MEIELTTEEARLLEEVLDRTISDLRQEIRHTDQTAYKEELKADEALLKGILAKVTSLAHAC